MCTSHAILSLDTAKKTVNKVDHEQPDAEASNRNYLGVVLTHHIPCAKDVEEAKLAFFKQFPIKRPHSSVPQPFKFLTSSHKIHA